ncbi:MAG: hypothetical protein AB7I38_11005 [Dehalococcoidia bacterium]
MGGGKAVESRWTAGNLKFYDKSGNVIATFDGANQRLYIAERRSVVIPLSAFRELSSDDIPAVAIASGGSGIMGKDATPNFEAVNGATDRAQQLQWAASNVDKISASLMLPVDCDGTRALGVELIAGKTGTMDTVALNVSAWFDRGDTEVTGTSANLANGTGAALAEVELAAADVPDTPGQMTLVLYPGTHGNDTVELYGVRVNYWSKAAA